MTSSCDVKVSLSGQGLRESIDFSSQSHRLRDHSATPVAIGKDLYFPVCSKVVDAGHCWCNSGADRYMVQQSIHLINWSLSIS